MTIYDPKDRDQVVPQPSISVDEIPTLSEIYQQDDAPVYYDFDGKSSCFSIMFFTCVLSVFNS